ncbi:MAG TPA: hypothetical protein VGL56_07125 [Fimbriimonadaceae bacterium]|jgi:hypothetical protein
MARAYIALALIGLVSQGCAPHVVALAVGQAQQHVYTPQDEKRSTVSYSMRSARMT